MCDVWKLETWTTDAQRGNSLHCTEQIPTPKFLGTAEAYYVGHISPIFQLHIFKATSQKKKINTVHNLITFSIVFTNKNGGGGRFNPPPPSKLRVFNTPSKIRLKTVFLMLSGSVCYLCPDLCGAGVYLAARDPNKTWIMAPINNPLRKIKASGVWHLF